MENLVQNKLIINIHRVKKKLYELEFPYNSDFITKIKEVCSERKWKPETKRWELKILMLHQLIVSYKGKSDIIFFNFNSDKDKSEFIKDVESESKKHTKKETELKDSLEKQSKVKDLLVEWREDVEKNGFNHLEYFKAGSHTPFPYQVVGAKFIQYNKNILLGMEAGVGKTLVAILGCLMKKELNKILCIVPNSLKLNWKNEINNLTDEKWHVIGYKENQYSINESKFVIVNYDYFRSSGFNIKSKVNDIGLKNIDCIIFDESHKIKNTKTNTYKNLTKSFKKVVKTYILLSGTPIESKITELYTQLNLILPNEFSNKNRFYEDYCGMKYSMNEGWVQFEKPDLEKIYNKLTGIMYRVKKSDVQKDLPPVMKSKIYLEMTDSERKEYELIESGLANVNWDIKNNNSSSINESSELSDSPLAILTRLRQFTSALKIKYCIESELIEEINNQGEKTVVFDVYIDGLKKLYEKYKSNSGLYIGETKTEERQKLVDTYQDVDSYLKNLFMSVATGNVGITLTAGNNMLLLTIPWLPSEIEQCIARMDRIGQKSTVKVFIPIIKNTIDDDVYYLVLNKTKVISKAIDNIDYQDTSDSSVLGELLSKYKNKYKK